MCIKIVNLFVGLNEDPPKLYDSFGLKSKNEPKNNFWGLKFEKESRIDFPLMPQLRCKWGLQNDLTDGLQRHRNQVALRSLGILRENSSLDSLFNREIYRAIARDTLQMRMSANYFRLVSDWLLISPIKGIHYVTNTAHTTNNPILKSMGLKKIVFFLCENRRAETRMMDLEVAQRAAQAIPSPEIRTAAYLDVINALIHEVDSRNYYQIAGKVMQLINLIPDPNVKSVQMKRVLDIVNKLFESFNTPQIILKGISKSALVQRDDEVSEIVAYFAKRHSFPLPLSYTEVD